MQHSPEALQQEIKALEDRLNHARRALQELETGSGLDDGLELIELSESDIVIDSEDDQLVERIKVPGRSVADPWAALAVAPSEPPASVVPDVVSVDQAWPAESASAGRDPLMTGTLAELYVSQGFTDKAMGIYRDILAIEPGNSSIAARLAELELQLQGDRDSAEVMPFGEFAAAAAPLPIQGTADDGSVLSVLEGWLKNIRRIRECR